jgi:hypothetical protein
MIFESDGLFFRAVWTLIFKIIKLTLKNYKIAGIQSKHNNIY